MAGAQLVSTPVEHQHIALAAVAGHELPRDLPCFRDPDYLVYGKSEAGGVLFGGYEHDPAARWLDGVPWEHSGQSVPADEARFAPLMQGAARRFPFLADAGVVKLVCHPDAMTPDGNPLVGELPGVPGLLRRGGPLAQRLRRGGRHRQGRGRARDRGRERARPAGLPSVAFRGGSPRPAATPPRPRARPIATTTACATRWTATCSDARGARARCTSGCRTRAPSSRAKNGWERADYCDPGRPWRRAGEEQRAFGWAEPPYAAVLAEESVALRERVGMIDMTSFGKIAVEGPGAAALLERVCDAHVDREPGVVVYTQFLNARGGHRRRRDRHAVGRGALPRRHGRRGDRLGPRLAAVASRPRAMGRSSCVTRLRPCA